jgi:hypothetical protein
MGQWLPASRDGYNHQWNFVQDIHSTDLFTLSSILVWVCYTAIGGSKKLVSDVSLKWQSKTCVE